MSKWIRVDDALPKHGENVIVTFVYPGGAKAVEPKARYANGRWM